MSVFVAIILSLAVFFAVFLLGEWLAEGGTLRGRHGRNRKPDNAMRDQIIDRGRARKEEA